ncbi:MAG: MMPL family transporter [Thermoplasmatota archaeon]
MDGPARRAPLDRWGRFIFRHRRAMLVASGVLLVACIFVAASGGSLLPYQPPQGKESARAQDFMKAELPGTGLSRFSLVVGSDTLLVESDAFKAALTTALAPLVADPRVDNVTTPYNVPAAAASRLIGNDGRHALVVVKIKAEAKAALAEYADLRAEVKSPTLTILATDSLAVNHEFESVLAQDLSRAELVSIPFTLLLLLVVFGTVVAALLPLGVGILAVVGGVAGVFLLSRAIDVTQYAMNVVTLIGLGVAIDYSLFIVNRFREEVAHGRGTEEALARAMRTAGRATLFSGLTVAVGLSGLAFFNGMYFASMGLAGTLVVAFAVLYALTFLPALLATLGPRVNKGKLPFNTLPTGAGFWHRLATAVMRRPLSVLLPALAVLLLAGTPFLGIAIANGGVEQLPQGTEAREGHDLLVAQFPDASANDLVVVAHFPGGDPLGGARVPALYDLSRAIAALPHVLRVGGPLDLDPSLTESDYERLYALPASSRPASVNDALKQSVGSDIVVLEVRSDAKATSDDARALVRAIRAAHPVVADGAVLVTGETAFDVDTLELIEARAPLAMAFIVTVTYFVLLFQTRSVVLPLKAVLLNLVSIAASFGAMVWIFQEGHGASLLGFTPAPLDPSLPILLFCIVFGLSMDYEVLLLARMQEEYAKTGDNQLAVAGGLERSGRLITGAAAIMCVVFFAFALAQIVIIKAIGLGLAVAVALDATLVRALIVPAAMRLMGRANWWAPTWMRRRGGPVEH